MEILFPHIDEGNFQNFPETSPPALKPISYLPVLQYETNCTCQQQGLALFGFFPYALSFSQSLTNADNIFISMTRLWSSNDLWFWTTPIYENLIHKMSMGPYVTKMFFLRSKQMKLSGYTGVWYKNVWTNIVLFNFALYRLVAELREI